LINDMLGRATTTATSTVLKFT